MHISIMFLCLTQSKMIVEKKIEKMNAIMFLFCFQSKTIAEQKAEKINAKLGYRPIEEVEEQPETPAETFKRYEEELDINDFPQTARWKVTSRVSVVHCHFIKSECNTAMVW